MERKETLKEQMLHAFAEAHDELLASIMNEVKRGASSEGHWGPREILAHIAAWEAEALERIPLLAAGAPEKTYHTDEFNAAAIAATGELSFQQVERRLRQTHQRLVSLFETLEESAFTPEGYVYEWIVALTSHSLEHARELAANLR